KKALAIKPEMVPAWTNLASVLVELEEYDDAVEAAQKAVSLAPTFGLAHNNLAVALYYKGMVKEAKEHAEKAKELGYPVHPDFLEKLNGS
ncbi:MAG TPA: tetratricopeptide repeat protein, partial [Dissulfuribacter thermophilus]|nr:tetratricopeptide repeat protein [Dissulfuribacter thermophilus]